jgi:hypothetical protein
MPHFRNSIPQELLHNSTALSQDSQDSPQTSFSSVAHSERSHSSSSNRSEERSRNASRASSIHNLLNPTSPSEYNCSTSCKTHDASRADTQKSALIIASRRTESDSSSTNTQDRPAAPPPPSDKPLDGESNDGLAKTVDELTPRERSNRSAGKHSTAEFSGAALADLSSQQCVPLKPHVTSRKRVFEEMEELAPPSSQSSGIRLSMALDGAVKVRAIDEETPSPPKQRHQNPAGLRKEGLRRSHSAVAASELIKEGQKNSARPTSGVFGRSRDARTWQFYCDGDARAALSAQAESENNGSAVGAINLIRSQSQNAKSKAQQSGKYMALTPKIGAVNRRQQAALAEHKPKMVRATSSMARLSSRFKEETVDINKTGKASHGRSPSDDSDKENWAPGTRTSRNPLRWVDPKSSTARGVLQTHLSTARSKTTGRTQYDERKEHIGHAEEMSLSKREDGHADSSTSCEDKEDDLDCIQGLLSLSQGAWR